MLSGGERQRVALARALAPRPRILLMDEPFSSLDPRLRDQVREQTVDLLRRTGTTTILVTHDPRRGDARRRPDRRARAGPSRAVRHGRGNLSAPVLAPDGVRLRAREYRRGSGRGRRARDSAGRILGTAERTSWAGHRLRSSSTPPARNWRTRCASDRHGRDLRRRCHRSAAPGR